MNRFKQIIVKSQVSAKILNWLFLYEIVFYFAVLMMSHKISPIHNP